MHKRQEQGLSWFGRRRNKDCPDLAFFADSNCCHCAAEGEQGVNKDCPGLVAEGTRTVPIWLFSQIAIAVIVQRRVNKDCPGLTFLRMLIAVIVHLRQEQGLSWFGPLEEGLSRSGRSRNKDCPGLTFFADGNCCHCAQKREQGLSWFGPDLAAICMH